MTLRTKQFKSDMKNLCIFIGIILYLIPLPFYVGLIVVDGGFLDNEYTQNISETDCDFASSQKICEAILPFRYWVIGCFFIIIIPLAGVCVIAAVGISYFDLKHRWFE